MKKILATLGVALLLTSATLSAKPAGSVNGVTISVEEANKALKLITNGKMTWDKLPAQGKKELMEMMAPSRLVVLASQKDLNAKEKENALSQYWMKQEMAKINITDDEAKSAYDKMVEVAKQSKNTKNIPPFSEAKNSVKLQLQQDRVVQNLMKNAKITID